MATTTLYVEILVAGAVSQIWIVLFLSLILSPDKSVISTLASTISELATPLVIPYIALTYALGWAVNSCAEYLGKALFQTKFRDDLFAEIGDDYYKARGLFFQKVSDNVVTDLRCDRHIVRGTRSNSLNFFLLVIVLLFYLYQYTTIVIGAMIISSAIAISSFFQYRAQYKSMYSKMRDTYIVIRDEYKNNYSENEGNKKA